MMIESMAGKSAALHGITHDSTPFKFSEDDPAADYMGDMLLKGCLLVKFVPRSLKVFRKLIQELLLVHRRKKNFVFNINFIFRLVQSSSKLLFF